jgi:hypothetical protein
LWFLVISNSRRRTKSKHGENPRPALLQKSRCSNLIMLYSASIYIYIYIYIHTHNTYTYKKLSCFNHYFTQITNNDLFQ